MIPHPMILPGACLQSCWQDDSLMDKLGSKLFHFDDHKAEVHKHATFKMVSDVAARYLEEKIIEAYQDLEL